jgi:hypothetical protein
MKNMMKSSLPISVLWGFLCLFSCEPRSETNLSAKPMLEGKIDFSAWTGTPGVELPTAEEPPEADLAPDDPRRESPGELPEEDDPMNPDRGDHAVRGSDRHDTELEEARKLKLLKHIPAPDLSQPGRIFPRELFDKIELGPGATSTTGQGPATPGGGRSVTGGGRVTSVTDR